MTTTFKKPTLVTITAPTCSGKSTLLNHLTQEGYFNRIVSTTTRPRRPGEHDCVDYYFISREQSLEMEANGEFFELIEFNGTRYGVTNEEMHGKMVQTRAPIVILEPQGLEIYRQKCLENDWDIYSIYVHVEESELIRRLVARTTKALQDEIDHSSPVSTTTVARRAFQEIALEGLKNRVGPLVEEFRRRLLSITGDERRWMNQATWDAIVPGDNQTQAIEMLELGVAWRNSRR